MKNNLPNKEWDWERKFDEIGFGNQARIVGTKRKELKDFIASLLADQRKQMIEETKQRLLMELQLKGNKSGFWALNTDDIKEILSDAIKEIAV